ncbi:NUDIX domain-containing protein [Nocardiopsis sp. Huas11]|uniref:NUDIX domain-containing protein n=1 Tax=Nocardiopsis sp. Huas11 TaxID=2183912 RepID=UPI0035137920
MAKQSSRALLFDCEWRVVFIKRTRSGQEPYWVSVGSGLEPEEADAEAALHREVFEELSGKIDGVRQVLLTGITDDLPEGVSLQHIFVARLVSRDPSQRTGPSSPSQNAASTRWSPSPPHVRLFRAALSKLEEYGHATNVIQSAIRDFEDLAEPVPAA